MIPNITERKLVIIESPFSGNVEENLRYLRACMRDAVLRGESPYASHGLLTQKGVLNDEVQGERDLGIQLGFKWHEVADYMVVYADLGITKGMKLGIENANRLSINVIQRLIMW